MTRLFDGRERSRESVWGVNVMVERDLSALEKKGLDKTVDGLWEIFTLWRMQRRSLVLVSDNDPVYS